MILNGVVLIYFSSFFSPHSYNDIKWGCIDLFFFIFFSPQLINASQEMTSDWVCKPAVLEDLLKSGDNELDYEFLSQTFCNLDKDTLISILDEVFKQLDIGDLVEEVWQIMLDIFNY